MQFFPKAQTLILKRLHKAIESPIIIHHAVTYASLVPLFAGLVFFPGDDHLPLGKIADHHSLFNQSVCDEMGGFVHTFSLLVMLAFRHTLVDLR